MKSFPKNIEPNPEPDYWEKLKHQYVGQIMQGILNNISIDSIDKDKEKEIVNLSLRLSNELVNGMKASHKIQREYLRRSEEITSVNLEDDILPF
jgi:hypothetical protein